MKHPLIVVGAGTEVCVRALMGMGKALKGSLKSWPEHVYMLLADSDRRSLSVWQEGGLPSDQVFYVSMSLHQVRDALSWRKEEFKDSWRKEWTAVIRNAPDNGALMLPSLGRLMAKAARPVILQHLHGIARRLQGAGTEPPQILFVMNPLSGTSRGSILEMPKYLRHVFPESTIQGILVYPVQKELSDPALAQVYYTNFVEALRILEYYSEKREYDVFVDPAVGWEHHRGELVNYLFAFDAQYGNQRFRHLPDTTFLVKGGLEELFGQVRSFLLSMALYDKEAQWLLGRMADVAMHHSRHKIEGHPTFVHSVRTTGVRLDPERLRRMVVERAVQKVATALAGEESEEEVACTVDPDYF